MSMTIKVYRQRREAGDGRILSAATGIAGGIIYGIAVIVFRWENL